MNNPSNLKVFRRPTPNPIAPTSTPMTQIVGQTQQATSGSNSATSAMPLDTFGQNLMVDLQQRTSPLLAPNISEFSASQQPQQPVITDPSQLLQLQIAQQQQQQQLYQLVLELLIPDTREKALAELNVKNRDQYQMLAPILWHSTGVMSVLLQEVIAVYHLLSPYSPQIPSTAFNRVCNALTLLQSVAQHPETRTLFLHAQIPLYLYPFLNTVTKSKSFDFLRLTSLGVIGALVKSDDQDVINFLLSTDIIPYCLRIMENGTELSKTVATFIVQKILLFDSGLTAVCATPERFYTVTNVLAFMVNSTEPPTPRLLKPIIRCYSRLADHPRAKEELKKCLPTKLRDGSFNSLIADDPSTKKWYDLLLQRIQ